MRRIPWTCCSYRTVSISVKMSPSVFLPGMWTSCLTQELEPSDPQAGKHTSHLWVMTFSQTSILISIPQQVNVWLKLTMRCQETHHSKSQSAQTQGSETTVPEESRPRAHWAPGLRFLNIFLSPMTQGSPLERKSIVREAGKHKGDDINQLLYKKH